MEHDRATDIVIKCQERGHHYDAQLARPILSGCRDLGCSDWEVSSWHHMCTEFVGESTDESTPPQTQSMCN